MLGWIAVASMLAITILGPGANRVWATHVTPIPISSGNPTCSDFAEQFGGTWTEFKLQDASLANGTYSDGTLTVTISNFTPSNSGTPGSFDWSSNIGVDAVFVKAGSDKHNLYVYNPEATSDTGLGPQAGTGNGISHISFCYDAEAPSNPPSVPASNPPSVPASNPPSVPASEPASNPPSVPASNPPSGGVEEATGTPGITPPSTSTDVGSTGSTSNGWLIPILGIALLLSSLLLLTPSRTVRRRR
jgi:hypothetical protein